jgi:hypothetical protein
MKNLTTIITAIILLTSITTAQFYSLSFDGVDDYVEVLHDDLLNISENGGDQGTIMSWIKINDINVDSYNRIISKKSFWSNPDGYELEVNPALNFITFLAGNSNFARGQFTFTNEWTHVVATFNGNLAKIYVNGVDVTIDDDIDAVAGNSIPLYIGNVSGSAGDTLAGGFDGLIDDVALYNNEYTQNEIQDIIINGITVNENVVGYWNFNEGTGATASDASGNGNDGSVYGATWNTDAVFPDPIYFELDSVFVRTGDTASVALYIDELQGIDIVGLEFEIDTGNDSIQIVGVNMSSSTEQWTAEVNHIDQTSQVAMAGFDPVASEGLLCELRFAVGYELPTDLYPLDILDVTINTGEYYFTGANGVLDVVNNHSPGEFNLVSPADGETSEVNSSNVSTPLVVSWGTAYDSDGDDVLYLLSSSAGEFSNLLSELVDNTVLYIPYQTIYDTMYYYGVSSITFDWTVGAYDNYDTTWASNGPWQYTIDVSQLSLQDEILPSYYILSQNFPNPFNPSTSIQYTIPENSIIKLTIFNIQGEEVNEIFNREHIPGQYTILWDGKDNNGNTLPSGMYFYRLSSKNYSSIRKMIFIK